VVTDIKCAHSSNNSSRVLVLVVATATEADAAVVLVVVLVVALEVFWYCVLSSNNFIRMCSWTVRIVLGLVLL